MTEYLGPELKAFTCIISFNLYSHSARYLWCGNCRVLYDTASYLECLGNLSQVTKPESGKARICIQKFWPLLHTGSLTSKSREMREIHWDVGKTALGTDILSLILNIKVSFCGTAWTLSVQFNCYQVQKLMPLAARHASQLRDKMLGKGKWLYSASQMEKMVDSCPKAPFYLGVVCKLLVFYGRRRTG